MSETSTLATLRVNPQVNNQTALGTTPVTVSFGSSSAQWIRLTILNVSASNHAAYMITDENVTATPQVGGGNFTCSAANALAATDGVRLLPGIEENITISGGKKLWLVGSAIGTLVQVTWFAQSS